MQATLCEHLRPSKWLVICNNSHWGHTNGKITDRTSHHCKTSRFILGPHFVLERGLFQTYHYVTAISLLLLDCCHGYT